MLVEQVTLAIQYLVPNLSSPSIRTDDFPDSRVHSLGIGGAPIAYLLARAIREPVNLVRPGQVRPSPA